MTPQKSGQKGAHTEELIRAYFLRAGFFVVRGVKLRTGGDDLTDIDVWTYERSATLARRRTVIDVKDKKVPQAAERLFFAKGLAEAVGVEASGVVTTDSRFSIKEFARKCGVLLIDGNDLQRLKQSSEIIFPDRISEEDFNSFVASVDVSRKSKIFRERLETVKSSVASKFGASCANIALEEGQFFAREAISAHPGSEAAQVCGRLTYFATSIAAAAIDYASADAALRPITERMSQLTNALRFGDDTDGTLQKLRWAEAAIREYLPNGTGLAQVVRDKFNADVSSIPAEGLAEIAVRLTKSDLLFNIARTLEHLAYSALVPNFDNLPTDTRSFMGAALDFYGVDRPRFSRAWSGKVSSNSIINGPNSSTPDERPDLDDFKVEEKPAFRTLL